ncbi:helix-turn-helix domain-containing protein [Granulosicoccus antarcticus]|uniref:HTH-type transcriptional activator RhaS n=1 Tax=Granulosicoccus antarcticus IMCC3135 TaxID=1192854 RepID=A0A2Z2NTH6_9GAMM|nr:AraC family transcriptional regulator [Granulosicoccus antarcticus]ASJ70917.1 HTH-type transcriptional activator RhaS [Granulosicoccus antarcticus IMCC3135]
MSESAQTLDGMVRLYSGDYAAHSHDYSQILFGMSGCLELQLEGRAARVDATTGLVVPAGYQHSYCSYSDSRVWVVDTALYRDLDKPRAFHLPLDWQPSSKAVEVLAGVNASPRVLQRRGVNPLLLEAKVGEFLHEAWPIARMAAFYALSVPQFHRRWKTLTGQTPQAWIRALRLDQAQSLLQAGHSLEAVASQVGYCSASALCYALQRDRGLGARELRSTAR